MNKLQKFFRLKPTQFIILSFVLMILIGTFLLMLPFSTTNHQGLRWIDALFVSTSASCVTGLTVVDLHNDLTFFGTVVMLMLIQVGGLGIMTLATLVVHTMGYRFHLQESLVLQESLNQGGQAGLVELIARMIKYTFVIEGFFAVVLTIHFIPEFGFNAIGYGIFHSISAFCNAGFDLFGNYDSLCKRNDDYFLMTCIGLLIILGGIGFTVMSDVLHKKFWRKYSLHTKIVQPPPELEKIDAVLVAGSFWVVDAENMSFLMDALNRNDNKYLKQLILEEKVFCVDNNTKVNQIGNATADGDILIQFKEGRYTNKEGRTLPYDVFMETECYLFGEPTTGSITVSPKCFSKHGKLL